MRKIFSILSWNIEHFKDSPERVKAVTEYLNKWKPDVFGLFEIEGKEIFRMMARNFPHYSFFITEGQQSQEILVACRKSFNVIAFQQKREFSTGNPSLRPGVLLSFERWGEFYGALFLHTDSGTGAADFGNRAEMFEHAFNLKKSLDKAYGNAKLVILGDLNTMGLQYPRPLKSNTRVDEESEVINLHTAAASVNMAVLRKEEDFSWMGSAGKSNLDHIIASTALKMRTYSHQGREFAVRMDGWNKLEDKKERDHYLKNISDHSLLYCEVVR